MAEQLYIDLHISNNDLTLDSGGEPVLLNDRDSIAQDIKHLIRESGFMVKIIGQRDPIQVAINLQALELLIEEDIRLIPGTIRIKQTTTELFFVLADTVAFGPIDFVIGL